jgi:hypothetical protein
MNEQPPPTPQFDISQILGLLSGMNNKSENTAPDISGLLGGLMNNNSQSGTNGANDLLLKYLLNGGLQKLLTPKPKEPEPVRTINLDNYIRVD